jgi:hypothetical protein
MRGLGRASAAIGDSNTSDTAPLPGLSFYDRTITQPWHEMASTDTIGVRHLFDTGLGRVDPVVSRRATARSLLAPAPLPPRPTPCVQAAAQILNRNLPIRLIFCIQQFLKV